METNEINRKMNIETGELTEKDLENVNGGLFWETFLDTIEPIVEIINSTKESLSDSQTPPPGL